MSLRILILSHHFSPRTETFIYHDALALQKYAEVKIGCFYRENEQNRPFTPVQMISYRQNWIIRKLQNLGYKLNFRLDFQNKSLKRQLRALLDEFNPDIIHLHFGIQALYFIDNLDFAGPIFITFHGYDATKVVKKSAIYRKRLRELFGYEHIYPLATSASLFTYMAQYDIESTRSRVMYSGIDLSFFKPIQKKQQEGITYTQISSFRSKKGHAYLIQAFQRLVKKYSTQKLQLILAGGGPLEKEMKNLTAQLGLKDVVHFRGWVTQQEAVALLQESDVFVHPSVTSDRGDMESTTIAILEAMAMELPIFATHHSGIPEIVEEGVNGLLAPEKDIDAYVQCLEKLMNWGRLEQNREKIAQHFSQKNHIQALLNAYQDARKEVASLLRKAL